MPMPLWAVFSPLHSDPKALLLEMLPDFLAAYAMQPFWATPLVFDGDDVLYLDAEGQRVQTINQMLSVSEGKFGVALNFFIPEVGCHATLIVFRHKDAHALCLSIPRTVLGKPHDRWGSSGWLVNFLSKLSHKSGIDCCAMSRDDGGSHVHASLNVADFVEGLKSGRAFKATRPVILVVRADIVPESELSRSVELRAERGFRIEEDGEYLVAWSV